MKPNGFECGVNEAIVVLEGLGDSSCNILLLKLNLLFLLPPVFVTCLSRSELCSFPLNPPRAPNLHLIKPLLNRTRTNRTNPEVTLFLPRRGGLESPLDEAERAVFHPLKGVRTAARPISAALRHIMEARVLLAW